MYFVLDVDMSDRSEQEIRDAIVSTCANQINTGHKRFHTFYKSNFGQKNDQSLRRKSNFITKLAFICVKLANHRDSRT